MCKLTIDDIHRIREEQYVKSQGLSGEDYKKFMAKETDEIMRRFMTMSSITPATAQGNTDKRS